MKLFKTALASAICAVVVSGVAMAADSLYVDADGNTGIGTIPQAFAEGKPLLHAKMAGTGAADFPLVFVAESATSSNALFRFVSPDPAVKAIDFNKIGPDFRINVVDLPNDGWEFQVEANGNVTAKGDMIAKHFVQSSSRTLKENIDPVNSEQILEKLTALQIAEWSYVSQDQRHMGPMAEDFVAAFKLGPDNMHVSPGDMAGVALAGVQALSAKLEQKDAQIAALQSQVDGLTASFATTHEKMEMLNVKLDARTEEMAALVKALTEKSAQPLRKVQYVP